MRKLTGIELDVFEFLNELRDDGSINMFGARPEIQDEFDLDKKESASLLKLWMDNFQEDGDYTNLKI